MIYIKITSNSHVSLSLFNVYLILTLFWNYPEAYRNKATHELLNDRDIDPIAINRKNVDLCATA